MCGDGGQQGRQRGEGEEGEPALGKECVCVFVIYNCDTIERGAGAGGGAGNWLLY